MNDFYVGYAPKAPTAISQFIRRVVIGLGLLALTVAAVLAFGQRRFANSYFEFGSPRDLEGILVGHLYPTLLVRRPGETGQSYPFSQYLLVAPGKHGADELVAGFDGQSVRLRGQLIYRDGGTMVEVLPGSIVSAGKEFSAAEDARALGPVTVTGEIVDSKCYLGVMNPGSGKVHRDCAARCVSGGIPPLFVTKDGRNQFLLVGTDGKPFKRDALREFIAEPITLHGDLVQIGDLWLLRIEPEALRHTPDAIQAALGQLNEN
jgi:hypothetical protein